MADLGDRYIEIFDKLQSVIEAMVDAEGKPLFKEVYQGWKTPVEKFPSCFLLPDPDLISPATTTQSFHTLRYIIAVVTEKASSIVGLKESIKLAGKVVSNLEANRTLDKLVSNLEPRSFEFHWRRVPGFYRNWTAAHIEIYIIQ